MTSENESDLNQKLHSGSKSKKIHNKRLRKHYRKSKAEINFQASSSKKQKTVSFQENVGNNNFDDSELGEAHKNLEEMTNKLVAQGSGNIFDSENAAKIKEIENKRILKQKRK